MTCKIETDEKEQPIAFICGKGELNEEDRKKIEEFLKKESEVENGK